MFKTFYILKNQLQVLKQFTFKYVLVQDPRLAFAVANGKTVIAYAKADDGTNPT